MPARASMSTLSASARTSEVRLFMPYTVSASVPAAYGRSGYAWSRRSSAMSAGSAARLPSRWRENSGNPHASAMRHSASRAAAFGSNTSASGASGSSVSATVTLDAVLSSASMSRYTCCVAAGRPSTYTGTPAANEPGSRAMAAKSASSAVR